MRPQDDHPERNEWGALWCERHGRYECTGQRSKGRGRCHGSSMTGLHTCRMHQGEGGKVKHLAAVQNRDFPLRVTEMDISPAEALLWRVRYLSALLASIDREVAELRRQEIAWGVTREAVYVTPEGRTVTRTATAALSVWIDYQAKIDLALSRAATAALQGVAEERMVRMAQAQGAKAFAAFNAGLGKLELSERQWALARAAMPAVLQELLS